MQSNKNYLTNIYAINKESILCNIFKEINESNELDAKVTIFQGLPKSDKMEYIIQKNIELGAYCITPVIMKRCVVKLENNKDITKKIERWQKIAESAAKQSNRDIVPEVEMPITIENLYKKLNEFDLTILAYEQENKNTLKKELQNIKDLKNAKIAVIIGPEGGIDNIEANSLISKGAKPVTLGKRILRTETAAIMVMSNIIYEYEM